MSDAEKWNALLWISGLPLTVADLKSIPSEFVIDVVICLHMVATRTMKLVEAECMLQSIVDVHQNEDPLSSYPGSANLRAFRLTMLYSKIFSVLHSCIAAVGLETFQVRTLLIPLETFLQNFSPCRAN